MPIENFYGILNNKSASSMKTYFKQKFIATFEHLKENNFFDTQKQFAQSLKISPQFLSQILRDNTPVPQDLLMRLFQAYPINLGFFFRDEQNILLAGTQIPTTPFERPVAVQTLDYQMAPQMTNVNGYGSNNGNGQPFQQQRINVADIKHKNNPFQGSNYVNNHLNKQQPQLQQQRNQTNFTQPIGQPVNLQEQQQQQRNQANFTQPVNGQPVNPQDNQKLEIRPHTRNPQNQQQPQGNYNNQNQAPYPAPNYPQVNQGAQGQQGQQPGQVYPQVVNQNNPNGQAQQFNQATNNLNALNQSQQNLNPQNQVQQNQNGQQSNLNLELAQAMENVAKAQLELARIIEKLRT